MGIDNEGSPGARGKVFEATFFPGIAHQEDLVGVVKSRAVELLDLKTAFVVEVGEACAAPEDCVVGHCLP